MAIYAYKRCSTNEERQSVDRQLFGKEFDEVVIEYASGKDEKGRPLFQELKKRLLSGDELHFNDLSRAGRNTKDLLATVEDLVGRGVKVVFHSENLVFVSGEVDPMAGAISKMLLTMLASVNELFLTQTRIAVKQGLEAAKAKGTKLGGASPKWKESMKKNKHNHKTTRLSEESKKKRSPVTQMIKDMIDYSQNRLTLDEIASNLNNKGITTSQGKSFSKATVSRIIKQDGLDYKKKNKYTTISA